MKREIAFGILLAIVAAIFAGCATQPATPLPTVDAVDLKRYAGTWYEMARLPNRFQSMCVADTQARYREDGNVIRVTNRCRKADGSVAEVNGIAKAVLKSNNAKLRVSFFRPFYGDYWILALDPDYTWALVGEPRREISWVLSRTPNRNADSLQSALDKAAALGFARDKFKITPQTQPLD